MISFLIALALQPAGEVPSEADRQAIMAAVGDRLLDGESARWRWPAFSDSVFYCGWVNAKNSFGAYTGFQQYAVIGTRGRSGRYLVTRIELAGDRFPALPPEAIRRMCAERGYNEGVPPG